MSFGDERLDVYPAGIDYVGWAYRLCEGITAASEREGAVAAGLTGIIPMPFATPRLRLA